MLSVVDTGQLMQSQEMQCLCLSNMHLATAGNALLANTFAHVPVCRQACNLKCLHKLMEGTFLLLFSQVPLLLMDTNMHPFIGVLKPPCA